MSHISFTFLFFICISFFSLWFCLDISYWPIVFGLIIFLFNSVQCDLIHLLNFPFYWLYFSVLEFSYAYLQIPLVYWNSPSCHQFSLIYLTVIKVYFCTGRAWVLWLLGEHHFFLMHVTTIPVFGLPHPHLPSACTMHSPLPANSLRDLLATASLGLHCSLSWKTLHRHHLFCEEPSLCTAKS